MKPRLHIGWILFALVMVWAESWGDVPKLLFPHRTTPTHFFIAATNVTAVIGLALYAFNLKATCGFWRLYAPIYAIIIVAQFGLWLPPFTIATARMMSVGGGNAWAVAGILAVTLPLMAMSLYSIIALFRLGDWIGPTRRPVGARQQQLSLPL